MAVDNTLSCQQFGNFLARRTEHLADEIIEDWFPIEDPWVGQVSIGSFPAFEGGGVGYEHTYDRFHVAYPNLNGTRRPVRTASCDGAPCNPAEKRIGMGTTRKSYALVQESITTDVQCWDQIVHIDHAKEQWAKFVEGLRKVSVIVNSNWNKTEALRGAENLYLVDSQHRSIPIDITESDDGPMVLDTHGAFPLSTLNLPFLQRFVEPLQLAGYFTKKFMDVPLFKLITGQLTSYSLREGNATLAALFRFDDFKTGGDLYKIGATSGIGNFAIAIDQTQIRFNRRTSDNKLVRVYPWDNIPATTGIKPEVSNEYINAEYAVSFIWHPMAMEIQTFQGQAVNSQMPFMVRDFAGKWRFAGPDSDSFVANNCTVDNKRRNQGVWFADWQTGTKYPRPELVRAMLHRNRSICDVNVYTCDLTEHTYVAQNTNAANALCAAPAVLTFTPTLSAAGGYRILANTITREGMELVHVAITGGAAVDTLTELVAALAAALPAALGTWAEVGNGTDIKLTGSNSTSVGLPFVA